VISVANLRHNLLIGKLTPVFYDDGISYTYVQYSNLYLLIASRTNINAAAFLGFLHKLKEVFVHYFNELEEESLRDNFVIAYELLDEVRHGFVSSLPGLHSVSYLI
jgi:hypothetical protein